MENIATFARSDPSAVITQSYQQPFSPMGQDQQGEMKGDGQYMLEIYSSPMAQGDLVMENNNGLGNYTISAAKDLSLLTTPLSNARFSQSDNLGLVPVELGNNTLLGANSDAMRNQQQQLLDLQSSSATGYSGAPAHRETKYDTVLQPDIYNPHPSRSNSRQGSPKQWHAEALLPAHVPHTPPQYHQHLQSPEGSYPLEVVVQQAIAPLPVETTPNEYGQQQQNEESHLIVMNVSKPSETAYQDVANYQAQAATSSTLTKDQQTHLDNYPLEHSANKNETRYNPYQSRTQYMPSSGSVTAVLSAVPSASDSSLKSVSSAISESPLAMASGEEAKTAYFQQHTQPETSVPGSDSIGLTKVLSPPPIPGRPWSQVPPPAAFGGIPLALEVIADHQEPFQPQQAPYVTMPKQQATTRKGIEDMAAVMMALRAHKETIDRQEEIARQQEELARQQRVPVHEEALARQEALAFTRQEAVTRQQQQQQQVQNESSFSGTNMPGVVNPSAAFGGSPHEISVVSPLVIQHKAGLRNHGIVRTLSGQELADDYRLMSPRGYIEQEGGSTTPTGRESMPPTGGGSITPTGRGSITPTGRRSTTPAGRGSITPNRGGGASSVSLPAGDSAPRGQQRHTYHQQQIQGQ
jgi:hypothetical protein